MLSLDLHPVFRSGRDIDNALRTFLLRAAASGEPQAEIVCGKGSGQLRERVLTFLSQPHVRRLHAGAAPDPHNPGRVLVRFERAVGRRVSRRVSRPVSTERPA